VKLRQEIRTTAIIWTFRLSEHDTLVLFNFINMFLRLQSAVFWADTTWHGQMSPFLYYVAAFWPHSDPENGSSNIRNIVISIYQIARCDSPEYRNLKARRPWRHWSCVFLCSIWIHCIVAIMGEWPNAGSQNAGARAGTHWLCTHFSS